ncbi:MAG: universal stress protein [candidate division NC10 bacterium]|nr:universal stress protein [candidate division NC10 bacterium]
MLRLAQILAPTDFSEHSSYALRQAAELARTFGAKLVLLHVVSNEALESISKAHIPPHPVDKVYEDLGQEVREQYAKHVPPGVRNTLETEILVLPGVPSLEIVRAARLKGVDLIMMATHGRTGLSHALVGSVTERVVRKAPCPVLSIRPVRVEAVAHAA